MWSQGALQGDVLWFMLFTDDIALVDESWVRVNRKLDLWRARADLHGDWGAPAPLRP
jgi:hypothetical protein